jgi:hypothetical protein
MLAIPELNDAQVTFGSKPPLPAWGDIPAEFKRSSNPFAHIASKLFFEGGKLADFGLTAKPGVDVSKAMRAIKCCLGSFDPSHEHKEAGVAYMLSQWFDRDEKKAARP